MRGVRSHLHEADRVPGTHDPVVEAGFDLGHRDREGGREVVRPRGTLDEGSGLAPGRQRAGQEAATVDPRRAHGLRREPVLGRGQRREVVLTGEWPSTQGAGARQVQQLALDDESGVTHRVRPLHVERAETVARGE